MRTGHLHAPDPHRDFHSRATSTAPQNMPTPRWDRFLTNTFGNDAEGREMVVTGPRSAAVLVRRAVRRAPCGSGPGRVATRLARSRPCGHFVA
ncbi:hypothetical protein [Streptomyces noursei]|uniref:hypothetical protein n=1 Tax=Streptomyces noursei TaxID=1971 RepID=UPI0030F12380